MGTLLTGRSRQSVSFLFGVLGVMDRLDGATLSATSNPIRVPYGVTSGTTSFNYDATDFIQAGSYVGIQIQTDTGSVVCSSGSESGSCGSVTVSGSGTYYLYAVRYNGTTVEAASTAVSVVDSLPVVDIDAPDTTTTYIGQKVFGGWRSAICGRVL